MTDPSTRRGLVRLVPTEDDATWDELVRAHDGATLFHTWSWLDFAGDLLGLDFARFLVSDGDRPIGVLPIPLGAKRTLSLPAVPFPFLGPLVPADRLLPTIAALRRWQWRAGRVIARVDLGPYDVAADTVSLLESAVHVHQDSTVAVDLSHGSLDVLHRSFSRMRRRNVTRALKSGAAIRSPRPGELAEILPRVLDEAYESHGRPSPYPPDVGGKITSWAANHPEVVCWVATVADEPAGALVMLDGHPTALAWLGGCLRRYRDESPNALLHRHVLEEAIRSGREQVDFCGWVDDSVGSYKLGFGGERRTYLTLRSSLVPSGIDSALRTALGHRRSD